LSVLKRKALRAIERPIWQKRKFFPCTTLYSEYDSEREYNTSYKLLQALDLHPIPSFPASLHMPDILGASNSIKLISFCGGDIERFSPSERYAAGPYR
jgi:hypothetical protein